MAGRTASRFRPWSSRCGSLGRTVRGSGGEGQIHDLPRTTVADEIEQVITAIGDLAVDADNERGPDHGDVAVDFDCRIADGFGEARGRSHALRELGPALRAKPAAASALARRRDPPVGVYQAKHSR